MKTRNGETIRRTDKYRHKFSDALAEYVYYELCAGAWDVVKSYSDADMGESFDRVSPRRILEEDYRGEVTLHRFDTVADADAAWQSIADRFAEWEGSDED